MGLNPNPRPAHFTSTNHPLDLRPLNLRPPLQVKNCAEYTAKKPETGDVGPGSYLGLGGKPEGTETQIGGGKVS